MALTGPHRGGRVKGQVAVTGRLRQRAAAQAEVKPLDVMLQTLANRWKESLACEDPEEKKMMEAAACAVAEKVAPYLHPKLQATTLKGDAANPITLTLELATAAVLKDSVR